MAGIPSEPSHSQPRRSGSDSLILGRKDAGETRNLRGPNPTMFPVQSLSSPERRRIVSLSGRLDRAKQKDRLAEFCNDEPARPKASIRPTMLDGINRHQRCFLAYSNQKISSQIPSNIVEPKAFLLPNSTVWSDNVPQNFHLRHEASSSPFTFGRDKRAHLSRRPHYMGKISGASPVVRYKDHRDPTRLGFPVELGKVDPRSDKVPNLARNRVELAERNDDYTPPICQRDQINGHIDSSPSPLIPPSIRIPAGKNSFRFAILPPGPLEVPRDLETSTPCTSQPGFTVGESTSPPTAGSTPLVESVVPPPTIPDQSPISKDDCMVRRLEDRMGFVHLNRPFLLGEMVTNPISDAHKCSRAPCGPINPSTTTAVSVCPSNVRQQDHSSCHKSSGIQESRHPKSCIVAVPPSLEQTPASDGVTHSGPSQCSSRPAFPELSNRLGMGTSTKLLQAPRRSERIARSGPLCNTIEPQIRDFRCPLCTSKGASHKCFHSRLESVQQHISIPSSKRNSSGVAEAETVSGQGSLNSSQEANSTMVPSPVEESIASPDRPQCFSAGAGSSGRSLTHAVRSMDRISFLKMAYNLRFPKEVTEALIEAYRKSSNHQFESGWRTFQNWLPRDVKIIDKAVFLSFIVYLRDKGYAHNTALGYRNALKIPMEIGFNVNTSDSEFDLLARSHFLHNPPQRKVIPSWGLDDAIAAYRSKGDIGSRSPSESFFSSLFLVAVATGNRSSELAHIDRSSIRFCPSGAKVSLNVLPSFLYKNQSASRSPPPIVIPAFLEDPTLCPMAAIQRLLSAPNPASHPNLFLNPVSHSPLNAASLRFWLCKAINWLLPDCIPRAHDVRKNAFSMAWVRGVPMEEIMRQGFWSSPSVFLRRYLTCSSGSSFNFIAAGSR